MVKNMRAVFVISLVDRTDRLDAFSRRYAAIDWHPDTRFVHVVVADPSHSSLQSDGDFAAPARSSVDSTSRRQDRHRACALSHILALQKAETLRLCPAMICEDDLQLTKEGALRRVPLPSTAALVSVGHDAAVTASAPIAYSPENAEALVAAKERGPKSSTAAYVIPTRPKSAELRGRLELELRAELRAPLDAILFHPRLFENHTHSVYLTKKPLFVQDPTSWSSIQS